MSSEAGHPSMNRHPLGLVDAIAGVALVVVVVADPHSNNDNTTCSQDDAHSYNQSPNAVTAATTGPPSAVGNVSGYRCVSDCRSRGLEFDPGPPHTFVKIDHEMISTVILLPSADSFKKGCCQLQAKVCARITG